MKTTVLRSVVEIGFIIFLFYSNLLMGELTRTGKARGEGIAWAVRDIFTVENFAIAVVAALVGYALVEILRARLWEGGRSK